MRICLVCMILQVAVVATHAVLPPGLYWKSKLPSSTPMPKSISDLLQPTGDGAVIYGMTGQGAHKPPGVRFGYNGPRKGHGGFETKKDNPNTNLFFLEKDLKSGSKIEILFTQYSNQASFLPREVVKSIPFSSNKMTEILNKFDMKPASVDAEVMKNTIEVCEESGIKGEDKYCATSLESMVDFTILKLGENVEAFCTEVNKKETKKQEYTITSGVKKVGETKVVVCHKLDYVYAVFYCHKIDNTVAYTVSLEGANGSRVKAVTVCHRDTSAWNPKHLAFQTLKVKPGSTPICHFLFQDSIAWAHKQN